MKAIIQEKYGKPVEVMNVGIMPKPEPKENEVLVRIKATTINDYDWVIATGRPILYRLFLGFSKPKKPIPGMEMAGFVEAVGAKVTKFKPGDRVHSDTSDDTLGTFAEYITLKEKSLSIIPQEMSFLEASALPHASLLAIQALKEIAQIKQGQKILINGAGGGVGTLALQYAKSLNCHVVGVDTGEKIKKMKDLGFDSVIDYKQHNFCDILDQYDIILDCKSCQSPFNYLKVLKPKGTYVSVGGKAGTLISILLGGLFINSLSTKKIKILALKSNDGLDFVNQLFLKGILKPQIDGPYKMEEIPRLINYFGKGLHFGKVVIEL